MNRFDLLDGSELLVFECILKLGGTEMEAICFEEIGENVGEYIRNSMLLNRKVREKFRRISSFPLKKIVLLRLS